MVTKVQVPAEDHLTHTPADNAKDQERPSWLPEQFNDGEDLWKSYQELRKDHTKKAQELAELKKAKPTDEWKQGDTPGEEPPETPAPEEKAKGEKPATVEEAEKFLPGFQKDEIQAMSDYAWENGSLTDEHYAKLAEAGYGRDVVDQFMAGQFAMVEGQRSALINAGGGEERVNHMFQWAAQSLSPAEIDAYNAKLDGGGPDALIAMETLVAKYEKSGVAIGGSMVRGENTPAGDSSVFRSTAQVVEAMNDPRYKSDPAYRSEVQRKLGRSKVF